VGEGEQHGREVGLRAAGGDVPRQRGGGQAEARGNEAQDVLLGLGGRRGVRPGGQLRVDAGGEQLAGDARRGRGGIEQPEVPRVRGVHGPLLQALEDVGDDGPGRAGLLEVIGRAQPSAHGFGVGRRGGRHRSLRYAGQVFDHVGGGGVE
jgi:hypothetical protein